VQLMEEDQTLPETARRDCRMLVNEIDRLNRNISQVLRYAKPARDTDQPADLVGVVRRVAALSRLEAEQHRVTLAIDAGDPCLVEGGEEAASDIISNLLVNALQASGDGTAIHIRLVHPASQPQYVELSVEDEGYGIPKDKVDKIFQPFFTTRAGGTGLGLAIVKRRVDEIGGFVECESPVSEKTGTSVHPGARFVVRFRVSQTLNHAGLGVRDSGLAINPGPESPDPKR
jgi:signal transduction histidine kinase